MSISAITIPISDGQTLSDRFQFKKTTHKNPYTFPRVLTLFYDLTETLLK